MCIPSINSFTVLIFEKYKSNNAILQIELIVESEKNIGKILRAHAEANPEAKDVLLQKITIHEQKSNMILDKNEYLKVLNQVNEVLIKVEEELASHTGGNFSYVIKTYKLNKILSDKENWWLCSNRFTVADIALTILLERLNQLGYENRFWREGRKPNLEKYYARVKQRESYKKTIPNLFFHVKMFIFTYQKPLIVGIGIGLVTTIAIIVGSLYLTNKLT